MRRDRIRTRRPVRRLRRSNIVILGPTFPAARSPNCDAALGEMVIDLAQGGIIDPPVPAALADRLTRITHLVYGTRALPAPLFDANAYIREFTSGAHPGDYVAIGIGGYGMFTVCFHYYLVVGDFGLFMQARVLEADSDGDSREIDVINARLREVEAIVDSLPRDAGVLIDTLELSAVGQTVDGGVEFKPARDPFAVDLKARLAGETSAVLLRI